MTTLSSCVRPSLARSKKNILSDNLAACRLLETHEEAMLPDSFITPRTDVLHPEIERTQSSVPSLGGQR